jgi:hypothetical protein
MPAHRPGTPAYQQAKRKRLRRVSRWLAPVALITSLAAIAAYVFLFVDAGGKACAELDPSHSISSVAIWGCVGSVVATASLLVAISILRVLFDAANE